MRTWFLMHPTVAVVLLGILWVVQAAFVGRWFEEGRWFLVVCGVTAGVALMRRIETWWHRT